ncbi:MAG: hypothetical protein IPO92_14720 [Saprospiraceae bacterium]|nr:hypothetical protein [Saprospiraceae bacterium]
MVSHLFSTPLGYEPNGRSLIYCYGLMMAGLFYMWLGLLFLYGYSRRYFEKWPIIIALLGLVLGTNLFYYTFHQAAMSHVYSFCLFSIFLWMVDDVFVQKKYIKNNAIFSWILLGLVFGMIVLIRPTNAILGIIPLYIWVKSEKAKFMFFKQNATSLAVFAFCIFVPFIPQCLYWKYISGHWFMYSYGHETFTYWKEPKLFRVLFDAWNGWILYSPIVIFPLTFLFVGRNSNRYFERSNIIILVIATYLFASWWAWWFGGAFGHRSYVEYLAILGLPFAGFIYKFCKSKIAMIIFGIVFVLFCYYNIGMTNAYNPPWDGENWTYQSVINEVKKLFYIQ